MCLTAAPGHITMSTWQNASRAAGLSRFHAARCLSHLSDLLMRSSLLGTYCQCGRLLSWEVRVPPGKGRSCTIPISSQQRQLGPEGDSTQFSCKEGQQAGIARLHCFDAPIQSRLAIQLMHAAEFSANSSIPAPASEHHHIVPIPPAWCCSNCN